MNKEPSAPRKKRFPWLLIVVIGLVGGVALTAGGFAYAANQETNDPFCASCHSEPETTYFQRSTAKAPVDLASFHTPQKTHCIDCHAGPGLSGRVSAELKGARNAFKWYTGTAVQPAVAAAPIGDPNCLKCHRIVTLRDFTPQENITVPGGRERQRDEEGDANHWHVLLAKWQAADPNAGGCVNCHPGHSTNVNVKNGMINDQVVEDECDACHKVMRKDD